MSSNFVAKGADGYETIMGRWSQRLAAVHTENLIRAGLSSEIG
jgi:hypothetical protein